MAEAWEVMTFTNFLKRHWDLLLVYFSTTLFFVYLFLPIKWTNFYYFSQDPIINADSLITKFFSILIGISLIIGIIRSGRNKELKFWLKSMALLLLIIFILLTLIYVSIKFFLLQY